MFFTEPRGFQNFFPRHAELTVMLTRLRVGVVRVDGDAGQEAEPKIRHWQLVTGNWELDALEFDEIINDDVSRMFEGSLQVFHRFIYPMHKDVLTGHAACDGDGNLAFAGAIHEHVMRLGPFGEGFAEEGFPSVRHARGRGVIQA